jgi:hypothetical protein
LLLDEGVDEVHAGPRQARIAQNGRRTASPADPADGFAVGAETTLR